MGEGRDAFAVQRRLEAEVEALERFDRQELGGAQGDVDPAGLARRYGRGAMLITSNRAVGEWGTVFGDAVVATAILDRLLHHSHVNR